MLPRRCRRPKREGRPWDLGSPSLTRLTASRIKSLPSHAHACGGGTPVASQSLRALAGPPTQVRHHHPSRHSSFVRCDSSPGSPWALNGAARVGSLETFGGLIIGLAHLPGAWSLEEGVRQANLSYSTYVLSSCLDSAVLLTYIVAVDHSYLYRKSLRQASLQYNIHCYSMPLPSPTSHLLLSLPFRVIPPSLLPQSSASTSASSLF